MKFGLLGTGYWAEHCHAAGLTAHPDVELVGVWGRDLAKAKAVADRLGVTATSDLDALLARVDAVAIAVPPDVQAELACRAAAAGCHLLLDKPLALSVSAAEQVVAATEHAGVASVVLFTLRFQTPFAQWLDETVLGNEWQGANIALLLSPPPPDGPFSHSPWRQKHGILWDIAPHYLSITLPALGTVATISATCGKRGAIHLTMTHAGGGLSTITLDCSMASPTSSLELTFWGAKGVVKYSPGFDGSAPAEFMMCAVSALVDSIDRGTAHPCDARFAAEIVRILSACEHFMQTGRAEISSWQS